MTFKDQNNNKKVASFNKCYNCYKLGHFERDWSYANKKYHQL